MANWFECKQPILSIVIGQLEAGNYCLSDSELLRGQISGQNLSNMTKPLDLVGIQRLDSIEFNPHCLQTGVEGIASQ